MLKFLLLATLALARAKEQKPSEKQLPLFKERTQGPIGILTSSAGAPIESRDAGYTLNTNLCANDFFMDTLTHFVRERTKVRAVHPKGAGAFGYFITTRDMSDICRAEFLCGVGKVTPVAVRLSMGATERGGSDLTREPRGFSVKLYTLEGNCDIPGFNTPVFTYKNPYLFSQFGHVMRKNPTTDFVDVNMVWDFITLHPESVLIFMYVFSDEGIPDGYRNMPGHSIHTYPLYNAAGEITYGRFHFRPIGGTKYLNSTEAARLGANDPDYCARDLYDAIASGDFPTFEVFLQLMTTEEVKNADFDPFDVTQDILESDYPWISIGKLVLNRNPKNYFAEVEQLAFCPGNLVPGMLGSPDKTFEARRFSYRDAQRYRLGVNFDKIPVNFAYRSKVNTYNRDGVPPVRDNGNDGPNYYPNSFNGPVPYVDEHRPAVPKIFEAKANNFAQAKHYYTHRILGEQRMRLVDNIVASLCNAEDFLKDRAVKMFHKVHFDLGKRLETRLKQNDCYN